MKTYPVKASTVVITGASSGIGKAAALKFAREGANVVLGARSETLLQDLASSCENLGGAAVPVYVDVSDPSSVQNLFEVALSHFGEINVWINNAGVGAVGDFSETPLEAHEQVIRTNLLGPLYGSYAVLPYFKERGKGIIINVNSTGSFVGAPYSVAYSASKFGLRGFSEALRFEVKKFPEIFVCELYAGFVDSPAMSHAANYLGKVVKPSKPLVQPEDMALAMYRLARCPRPSIHLGSQDILGRIAHFVNSDLTGYILEKGFRKYLDVAKRTEKTSGNLFGPDYDKTYIHGGYS